MENQNKENQKLVKFKLKNCDKKITIFVTDNKKSSLERFYPEKIVKKFYTLKSQTV